MVSDLKLCVDRVIPAHLDVEAKALALAENPDNGGKADASMSERLALVKRKMWRNGRTLRVRFLDGTPFLRERVKHYANEWTKYANLTFDFADDPRAEIRVSFAFDPGRSWSALGSDALEERYFPLHQPTVNFGWLEDKTPQEELSRVIIHEFGHAIGCIHEHQNPAGGIVWNEEVVLRYYAGRPNYWDEATTRFNVLDKYAADQLKGSRFDPDSIMLYAFPASFTQNGVGSKDNSTMSTGDIEFIKSVYPKR